MKKVLLSTVALIALTATAGAADLPSRAPAPAPFVAIPVFTWTGFYVGAQIGYAWGDDSEVTFLTRTGLPTGFATTWSPDGVVGGVHAGFNYQFGSIVVGVEGDIEATGIEGGYTRLGVLGRPFGTDIEIDWWGSLRARLGFAVDRFLVYATGGLAYADLKYNYFNTVAGGVVLSESIGGDEWGWTLGGGVEFAFTNNFTARVEYRYTQFDNFNNTQVFAFPGLTSRHEPEFHTVRAGISYKF